LGQSNIMEGGKTSRKFSQGEKTWGDDKNSLWQAAKRETPPKSVDPENPPKKKEQTEVGVKAATGTIQIRLEHIKGLQEEGGENRKEKEKEGGPLYVEATEKEKPTKGRSDYWWRKQPKGNKIERGKKQSVKVRRRKGEKE